MLFLAPQDVLGILGPLLNVFMLQSVLYNTIILIFQSFGVMLQYLQDSASEAIKHIQILQANI